MAQFSLKAGASIDLLTKPELDDALSTAWHDEMTARGWGMKYLEAAANFNGATISANVGVIIPETPNAGYIWALRTVGFITPTAAIAVVSKVADQQNTSPTFGKPLARDTSNTVHAFQFSGVQAVLKAGEFVALNTAGASTIGAWVLTMIEVPEELAWKVM